MAKVDLEKFICSLLGINYKSNYDRVKLLIEHALKEQGLMYKDGTIVEANKE